MSIINEKDYFSVKFENETKTSIIKIKRWKSDG